MESALLQAMPTPKISEWHDCWFNEHKKTGYVAVTDFQKQYFYGANDVPRLIKSTAGREKQFISINAFNVDWEEKKFSRKTTALRQIRNIAIDIDQYNLGLTIDEALDEIQALILSRTIPEPNLILTSRGVQLFYSIDKGASPEMSWLAEYITGQLVNKLKHIGADSNAKDMSRVMRVPNSINERNNATVKPFIWNDETYSLQELQAYCKPLDKFKRRSRVKGKIIYFPLHKGLEQHYKTNHARTTDFMKLIELRNGDFTNTRNIFLYMFSYHEALKHDTQKDLLAYMKHAFQDVYSRTDKPMSNREFERTVKSAYKDAEQFFEHYKDNGYRVVYKANDGIKKPFKTSNIIEKLNITEEEQFAMRSIRNGEVKRRQHADYMRKKRLEDGTHKQTRAEYEASRQSQRLERVTKLADLLEEHPNATQRELAALMQVSLSTLKRDLRVIDK